MRTSSRFEYGAGGFTLTELLMTMAISTVILGAIVVGSVTVQRSLQASDDYTRGLAAQLRALDYIALDSRQAISAGQTVAGDFLDLTVPDFYDMTNPNNPVPRAPNLPPKMVNGVPTYYGSGPVNVGYKLSGNNIVRTYNGVSTTIVSNVKNVQVTPPVNPDPNIVISISFLPSFHHGTANDTSSQTATTQTVKVLMRNSQKLSNLE